MRREMRGVVLQCVLTFALLFHAAAAQAVVNVSAAFHAINPDGQGGVAWVSVNLSNPSSRPVDGRLEFSGYGYRGSSIAVVRVAPIPPGGSRTINVAVPVIDVINGEFRESNGDRTPLNLTSSFGFNSNALMVLYASDQSNRLTDDELDAFTYRIAPDVASSSFGSATGGTTRSLSSSERVISQISTDSLPENWLCYTPLKTVVMSASSYRVLTAPRRQAIETWLHMGGDLVLFGEDESTTETAKRGRIIHTRDNPIIDTAYQHLEQSVPFAMGEQLSNAPMPYRESTAGGRGGAFLLATIFLIVVGPVNYWYFSRRNEIRKLLVTVPLISLGFCSLIAGYFVITQGFNRKGGSLSVTAVDEATNRAVTMGRHSLLSGLYPLGGLHFSSETYLRPIEKDDRESARFDLTREIVLESGLFKPGIPFDYSTIKPYTTRERLMFEPGTGVARNGFELPMKAVAVLHEGRYYTGGAVGSGGQVKMAAVDDAEVATLKPQEQLVGQAADAARMVRLLGRQLLDSEEMEDAASLAVKAMDYPAETSGTLYVALLDGIPKTAETGVEISDGRNLHLVIGRTAPDPEPAKP